MESFQKGDRVSLTDPLGPLKTTDVGIVVEVYGPDENLFENPNALKELEMNRGLFDYGVAFPQLRNFIDPESAAWVQEKVDLSQFHAGDVIPCRHDELVLIDSALRVSE